MHLERFTAGVLYHVTTVFPMCQAQMKNEHVNMNQNAQNGRISFAEIT